MAIEVGSLNIQVQVDVGNAEREIDRLKAKFEDVSKYLEENLSGIEIDTSGLRSLGNAFKDVGTGISGLVSSKDEAVGGLQTLGAVADSTGDFISNSFLPSIETGVVYTSALAISLNEVYKNGVKASRGMLAIVHTGPAATHAMKGLTAETQEAKESLISLSDVSTLSGALGTISGLIALIPGIGTAASVVLGGLSLAMDTVSTITGVVGVFEGNTKKAIGNVKELGTASNDTNVYLSTMEETLSGISMGGVDIEIKTDVSVESLSGFLTESTTTFLEIARVAKETGEDITEKLQEEVNNRKEIQNQQLKDQEAAEIEKFTQTAALLGYSTEEFSAGVASIKEKYKSLKQDSDEYTEAMALMAEELAKNGKVSEQTWARVQAASSDSLNTINADLELNIDAQRNWTNSLLDNDKAAIKSLDISKFEDYAKQAIEYQEKTVNAIQEASEKKIDALNEELEAGNISQESYREKLSNINDFTNKEIETARLRKEAVINQLLEEVARRNDINKKSLTDAADIQDKMIDQENTYNDNIATIRKDCLDETIKAGRDGNKARGLALVTEKKILDEKEKNSVAMSELYKKQGEALSNLDGNTFDVYNSIYNIAKNEGVNISGEVENMTGSISKAVEHLPEDMQIAGTDTFNEYSKGMDKAAGYEDGKSTVMEEKATGYVTTMSDTLKSDENKEQLEAASAELVNVGVVEKIDDTLKVEDGVSTVAKDQGKAVVQGLIYGLNSLLGTLKATMLDVANVLTMTVKVEAEINSPSRLLRKQGEYAIQGLELGIQNRLKPLQEKMLEASSIFTDPFAPNNMKNVSGFYDNRRDYRQNFSTTLNVQGNVDSLQYRREVNRLMRRQAAAIAR